MWWRVFAGAVLAIPLSISAVFVTETFQRGLSANSPDERDVLRPLRFAEAPDPEVSFAPIPDFVVDVDVPAATERNKTPPDGVLPLLFDYQFFAGRSHADHFHRQIVDTANQAGANAISQISIPFDPARQSVQLHHLVRTRDGVVETLNDSVRLEFVRPDSGRETGMFSGQVTALLRVPGMRAGDRLELAYTIRDQSPVTRHRYTLAISYADQMVLYDQVHVRSSWPRGPLNFSGHGGAPEVSETYEDGRTILSYGPGPVEFTEPDYLTPPWRYPYPVWVGTQYENWHEVAEWAAELFQPVSDPDVDALAQTIMQAHPDEDERIMAALRHLQSEIDYFAIMLGEGGYRPLHPAETLRFSEGDCKAKTLLLISLLHAMGIEAEAALVSTTTGRGLDVLPPTPQVFDHVIVTLARGNRRYWLDPTGTPQHGDLRDQQPLAWGYALIANDNSYALTQVERPLDRVPFLDIEERFSIASADRDDHRAVLRTEWVYRTAMADLMRAAVDFNGEDTVLAGINSFYAARFADMTPIGDATLEEDPESGHLVLSAEYQVELFDFSAEDAPEPTYVFVAHGPSRQIVMAPLENREAPLAMPYPYDVRHRIVINLPEGAEGWIPDSEEALEYAADLTVENDVFELMDERHYDAEQTVLTARTRVMSPEILPEHFTRVGNDLQTADQLAFIVLGEHINVAMDPGRTRGLVTPSAPPIIPGMAAATR